MARTAPITGSLHHLKPENVISAGGYFTGGGIHILARPEHLLDIRETRKYHIRPGKGVAPGRLVQQPHGARLLRCRVPVENGPGLVPSKVFRISDHQLVLAFSGQQERLLLRLVSQKRRRESESVLDVERLVNVTLIPVTLQLADAKGTAVEMLGRPTRRDTFRTGRSYPLR